MRKLTSFLLTSLNGFYKDRNDNIDWHIHGREQTKYSEEMLENGNTLLLGRKTYENMALFWPSQMALEMFPKVAQGMNLAEKIVFSNSLKKTSWENTKIINGDIVTQVKELKKSEGNDLTILGSGSIVELFTVFNLIDEYQVLIDPVFIGKGVTVFSDIKKPVNLKLFNSIEFSDGSIILFYTPI